MDPKPSSQPNPERVAPPQSAEGTQTPESMPQSAAESAANAPQAAPAPVPILPQVPVSTPVSGVQQDETADEGPAIADDVDVIEKEWVDKAQDVIAKTKDDPYQEEEQIEGLQIDYLKKRYGKDLKKDQ